MATITDSLVTILKLQGVSQYTSGMMQATQATQKLARATTAQATTGGAPAGGGGLGGLLSGLAALGPEAAIAGAAVGALVAVGKEALSTFGADEQAIFRATVVLKNLGSSLPIAELQAYASELQKTIAIDDEAVVALGGLLARFGLTGQQIKSSLRPIIDAAAATGMSIQEIGQAVGRAAETGQGRGLRALGIQFKDTGNEARNLKEIIDQINLRFEGAGAAQRNTLLGTVTALKESFANLFSAIGERLAVVVIPVLNGLKWIIDHLTENLDRLFPLLAILHHFEGNNPGANVGHGGDPAVERLLGRIADNTDPQKQADALAREVLGGAGTVAAGAVNWRDFNMAMGV